MRRELQRLSGTVAWLVEMVARILTVQAGLALAVDRLEQRTSTDSRGGRHARPGRPQLRLLRRVGEVTVGMVVVGLLLGVGQGFLPETPGLVPPAVADPTTTVGKGKRGVGTPSTVGPHGALPSPWGAPAGRPTGGTATTQRVGGERVNAEVAGRTVATPTTTVAALPGVTTTTTTLLELPTTTLPELPPQCRGPHPPKQCGD